MKKYWIWLSLALGPACPIIHGLLKKYASPLEIYENRKDVPLLFPRFFSSAKRKRWETVSMISAEDILRCCMMNAYEIVTPEDAEYPPLLFEIEDCPIVLYASGDISLLQEPFLLSVVGSRKMTVKGCNETLRICRPLSKVGVVLVSGFNIGGDEFAHKAALSGCGKSIAVLANGLDIPPRREMLPVERMVRKNGLFITEFPPGIGVVKASYHIRNRIISGMSAGVLIPQATVESGTMMTAGFAADQGRDVFTIPADANDPMFSGNYQLLKDGAVPVASAEDILFHIWPQIKWPLTKSPESYNMNRTSHNETYQVAQHSPSLTVGDSVEETVLRVLRPEGMTCDEICQLTGLPAQKVMAAISVLEITARIKPLAGKRFAPV